MFKRRNTKKKIVGFVSACAVFIVGIYFSYANVEFDLVNLRQQNPDLTRAYDIIKTQQAWEEILNSGQELSGTVVNIGILDTGFESSHLEFDRVVIDTDSFVDHWIENGGHGTQVLGIIGANNNAPDIKDNREMNGILSGVTDNYKLFSRHAISNDDFGQNHEIETMIEDLNVRIINISGGGTICSFKIFSEEFPENCISDEDFTENFANFHKLFTNFPNVLFVVGAGNDDTNASNTVPGGAINLDNTITVGATDLSDNRFEFLFGFGGASNFGNSVDISAPGTNVYAPKPGNDYDTNFSGTSASAPMVTGVAGLLRAINPNLTPAQIKQILIETGDPINTDEPIGPRLNAHSAVCHPLALDCTKGIAWDISSASLAQSLDVSGQNSNPTGLFFRKDGLKMYISDSGNNHVSEYNLSASWDISTASFFRSFSVSSENSSPRGIFFKPDGLRMYIIGAAFEDEINEYSLSTAWDISSAVFVRSKNILEDKHDNTHDLFFREDGLKMYTAGTGAGKIYGYDLSSAWDISTASLVQSYDVAGNDGSAVVGIFFNRKQMFVAGNDCCQEARILGYELSSSWDIMTAEKTQEYDPSLSFTNSIFFKPDGTRMYLLHAQTNTVYEYDLVGSD